MSDLWGHLTGVIIVMLLCAFLGVWVWAWRPRHSQTFGRMARIPMGDDTTPLDQENTP